MRQNQKPDAFASVRRLSTVILTTTAVLLAGISSTRAGAPAGYYDSAGGLTGSALKAELHNIIDDHTRYPYTDQTTDTWDIIETADEDPDNSANVLTIYRNRSHAKTDHWSSQNTSGWNREHSWPKSYGFTSDNSCNYPYTDTHHLFASNGDYNSARSNLMFNWVPSPDAEYPVDNAPYSNFCWNCDQFQGGDWEVWAERRGDIARAQFYMAVRYEGGTHGITGCDEPDLILTNDRQLLADNWSSRQNFSPAYMGFLSTMVEWHLEDPPDAREMARNDIIYSFQGNRNPFVDHPEWVCEIWGSQAGCDGSGGGDTTAPSAPSSLVASAGDGDVSLDWLDNSETDLDGYNVYRSTTSGGTYSQVNSVLVTTSDYLDTGLFNGTTYYYVVTAVDASSNESTLSNEASATPTGSGTETFNVTTADFNTAEGSIVSGSHVDTHSQNNVYEVLQETSTNGRADTRQSMLSHTWTMNVAAGSGYTFHVDAHRPANSEGDDFVFAYSKDNSTFTDMVVVTANGDTDSYLSYTFPEDVSGTLYIRVQDTDRNGGNPNKDTVSVDDMLVVTSGSSGDPDTTPPAAPSSLTASAGDAQVSLNWFDNTESDLAGYNVYRSTTSGSGYAQLNGSLLINSEYLDSAVTNGTAYYYVVTAVDTSANESANSNEASATPQTSTGDPTTMHVSAIALDTPNMGQGNKAGQATVTIVDNNGNPVSNATVTGTFSGTFNESGSAVTDGSGNATITTTQTQKGGVSFTFCVDGATHSTLTYDANSNVVTCNSI